MKDTLSVENQIKELTKDKEELIGKQITQDARVKEVSDNLKDLREQVDAADQDLNEAKRDANKTAMLLQRVSEELDRSKLLLDQYVYDNAVEAFVGEQDDFDTLVEKAMKDELERINTIAKFSKPIDPSLAFKSVMRKVKSHHDFSDLSLSYRSSVSQYHQALQKIGGLMANKASIPVSVSLEAYEPVQRFVNSKDLRTFVGIT